MIWPGRNIRLVILILSTDTASYFFRRCRVRNVASDLISKDTRIFPILTSAHCLHCPTPTPPTACHGPSFTDNSPSPTRGTHPGTASSDTTSMRLDSRHCDAPYTSGYCAPRGPRYRVVQLFHTEIQHGLLLYELARRTRHSPGCSVGLGRFSAKL